MTRPQPRRREAAAMILVLIGLAACGHTASTHYFSLTAIPPDAPPDAAARPVNVGRLTVRWPTAFDRLEVVRPTGAVELEVEELMRWSAAPGELAATALTQDLQARLPSLTLAPAGSVPSPDALNICVQVIGLDVRDRTYSLTTSIIVEGADGATRTRDAVTFSTPANGTGAKAEAEALSRLFAAVADRIIPALRQR